jgi:AcrR family transcriptional regulator
MLEPIATNPAAVSVTPKGERTRQLILDAAYRLFIDQGFHATSMRQIAASAGVALSGIYNHFASKEEIFDQILLDKHPYRQILEVLQKTAGDDVETFVQNAVTTTVEILGQRPDFLKLVFIELSEFQGKHAAHLYQVIYPQMSLLFLRFTDPGGNLRPHLPTQAVLFSFLGMLFSYYLTASVSGAEGALPSAREAIRHYLDIFLHGVLKAEQS